MAFWGLVLEPHKKYTQGAVEQPFHVSMATLDLQNCDPSEESSSLVLRRGEADFILCNLSKKKGILNVPLNLDFEIGGQINFHIIGNSSIHLTGYIQEEYEGFDSDDSLEEEEDAEDLKSKSDLFRNTKKLLEESTSKRKPDVAAQNKSKKVKIEAAEESEDDDESDDDFDMEDDDSDDSGEGEEDDDSEEDDDDDEEEEDEDEETEAKKKAQEVPKQKAGDKKSEKQNNIPNAQNSQQGKKDKKAKNQNQPQQSKALNTSLQNKTANGSQPQSNGLPPKRIIEGGIQVEDLRVGNGPVAKRGKMVAVYYVGRLKQNNKQFDATQSGQGFKFRLGAGEVIKGWDIGVAGMKVGSKRRLTIPAKMAYGPRGAPPDIPPNSTLVFEVELKNVH